MSSSGLRKANGWMSETIKKQMDLWMDPITPTKIYSISYNLNASLSSACPSPILETDLSNALLRKKKSLRVLAYYIIGLYRTNSRYSYTLVIIIFLLISLEGTFY